eukprot:UN0912
MVLKFAAYYKIPDKTVILAQIQSTILNAVYHDDRRLSITGQGIHSDGSDRAVIVGLRRGANVGASNQFHAKLDGSEPLCEPISLGDGECIFFKDNTVFHYVTPGATKSECSSGCDEGARTILLMHAPAEMYLSGQTNRNGKEGVKASSVQLRHNVVAVPEDEFHI